MKSITIDKVNVFANYPRLIRLINKFSQLTISIIFISLFVTACSSSDISGADKILKINRAAMIYDTDHDGIPDITEIKHNSLPANVNHPALKGSDDLSGGKDAAGNDIGNGVKDGIDKHLKSLSDIPIKVIEPVTLSSEL